MKSLNRYLAILMLLAPVACKQPSFADRHPNPKPGTEELPPVYTDITSIYSLNTDEGFVNSHANEWQNSSVEKDFRSAQTIGNPLLTAINAQYPRFKRLSDGSFLLIYQQGPAAHDVYYAKSYNFASWQNSPTQLFAKTDMNQYESSVADRVLFSSADAIVLDNGDVLAFASFRLNAGYRLNPLNNGIMMRRSTDNGNSWSDPEVIYRGTTWEPSALKLSSGEVHVYFTSADPNTGDSGTALLRSTDGGESWESVGKIVRQAAGEATDNSGNTIFTDQMPVAIQLNDSERIAVAFESRFGRNGTGDQYHLGMAYSDDDWAGGGLAGYDEGPAERQNNLFLNQAAPYLRQFRSGETLHSCNINQLFNVRLGDSKAWEFGLPEQVFPDRGVWGSVEIIDDHCFVGVFPSSFSETIDETTTARANIQLAKFVLNHRVNAAPFTPEPVGSSENWDEIQDALFIGSVSQAQTVFRFAYDQTNLYCMVERMDGDLAAGDGMKLMFQSGDATGTPLAVTVLPDAATGTLECDASGVECYPNVLGTFDETENDRGYVFMLAIPRTRLSVVADRLLFNAVLYDTAGEDTFSGLTESNYNKWLTVELREPIEPEPEPEPGDNDNGQGPKWGMDEEIDPW